MPLFDSVNHVELNSSLNIMLLTAVQLVRKLDINLNLAEDP